MAECATGLPQLRSWPTNQQATLRAQGNNFIVSTTNSTCVCRTSFVNLTDETSVVTGPPNASIKDCGCQCYQHAVALSQIKQMKAGKGHQIRPKPSNTDPPTACRHPTLQTTESSHAAEIGYTRPNLTQLTAAADPQEKSNPNSTLTDPETFPAPLILPDDDLSLDPKHPTQSLLSWIRGKSRNQVTQRRRTIYIAAPPKCDEEVAFVMAWTDPQDVTGPQILKPKIKDVFEYLSAFYYPLPVQLLPKDTLRFKKWEEETPKPKSKPEPKSSQLDSPPPISLSTSDTLIRISTRSSSPYPAQLSINDLLDTAIEVLPSDAYALLMLVNHDLYEDDEDEFVCGRAYGGSRVAVVSTARYHPVLDERAGVERDHAWPASHCKKYVKESCGESQRGGKKRRWLVSEEEDVINAEAASASPSPIRAAISAHSSLPNLSKNPSITALSALWLGRLCRTASHELGHCFGIGHCVYYACSMQGSASLLEDARQPPYLCPVDEVKVARATGSSMEDRYQALLGFCEEEGNRSTHLFAAYGAWLRLRIEQLAGSQDVRIDID